MRLMWPCNMTFLHNMLPSQLYMTSRFGRICTSKIHLPTEDRDAECLTCSNRINLAVLVSYL